MGGGKQKLMVCALEIKLENICLMFLFHSFDILTMLKAASTDAEGHISIYGFTAKSNINYTII